METPCTFQCYFEDIESNRRELFKEALTCAKNGKVLYVLHEELSELPNISQDLALLDRYYLKMLSFLYVKSLTALIESVASLPDWQSIPCAIILDSLHEYCPKDKIQNACGVVALLLDTARRCSATLGIKTKLVLSVSRQHVGDEYCNILQELYPDAT